MAQSEKPVRVDHFRQGPYDVLLNLSGGGTRGASTRPPGPVAYAETMDCGLFAYMAPSERDPIETGLDGPC